MTSNVKSESPPYGVRPPGYRLPDATRLGRVRLQVSDLERSIAYYEGVLGLRPIARGDGSATLGPLGEDVAIVELNEDMDVRPVPRHGRLGLYHFAVLLPNRPSLGRFVQHLSDSGERAGMSDHFVSEAIYLQDPDNLGIEVYADRPRDTWRHEGGQLAMTTIPLDVRDLVASAGELPWTGMPPGTRLGHVHLHVGDIEQAERFYHVGIGFDKTVWSYPGALFMSAGGYHHHLGANTWARNATNATQGDARLLEWEILLPASGDLDAAAESLEVAGYTVTRDGGQVLARDPWDTVARLKIGPSGTGLAEEAAPS